MTESSSDPNGIANGVANVAERLSSQRVFSGRVFAVHSEQVRLPNGAETRLDVIRHPGATCIVPLTGEDDVLLVRQYRYCAAGWMLEVPAGTLEPGEELEACARREVEEEAAVRAEHLHALGFIWTTPGFTDERIWIYVATGLSASRQNLDADESMSVERLPLARAVAMAESGEITDAKSIAALMRAAAWVRAGRPA